MADKRRALFGQLVEWRFFLRDQRINLCGFEIEEAGDDLLFFYIWQKDRKVSNEIPTCSRHLAAIG
jgi:hypothetical protein